MKLCVGCNTEKSSFWKNKRNTDGLDRYCVDCQKEMHKDDYNRHKEKRLLNMKKYQQRPGYKEQHKVHQDTWLSNGGNMWMKEYQKEYHLANVEKRRKTATEWYKNNSQRRSEILKKYRRNNYGAVLARVVKRRAQQMQAIPIWFEKEAINAVYRESVMKSVTENRIYHVDHIIPLNNSMVCGLHCLANLRVILAEENLTKHNKLIEI